MKQYRGDCPGIAKKWTGKSPGGTSGWRKCPTPVVWAPKTSWQTFYLWLYKCWLSYLSISSFSSDNGKNSFPKSVWTYHRNTITKLTITTYSTTWFTIWKM